LTRD